MDLKERINNGQSEDLSFKSTLVLNTEDQVGATDLVPNRVSSVGYLSSFSTYIMCFP